MKLLEKLSSISGHIPSRDGKLNAAATLPKVGNGSGYAYGPEPSRRSPFHSCALFIWRYIN